MSTTFAEYGHFSTKQAVLFWISFNKSDSVIWRLDEAGVAHVHLTH